MKDFEKSKDALIDEFYNEEFCQISDSLKHSDNYINFEEKLKHTSEKLKLLENEEFNYEINLESLIEQGLGIKTRRKSKIELILFIVISAIILSTFALLSLTIGIKIFVVSQITFIVVLPWSLIPISILKAKGGEL